MSFINISHKASGEPKRFIPTEIKCYKCTEPGLKLKFGGRDELGKIQYIDLYTNEIHQCKTKYLKTVTCKLCGESGLKWVKSSNTKSRVELMDKNNKLHNCQNRGVSDYYEKWNVFWNKYVIWEKDSPEVKAEKMARQDKLRYHREEIPEELCKKYEAEQKEWLKHDFNNFKTCMCKQCIYRREHPPERTFTVKKRV